MTWYNKIGDLNLLLRIYNIIFCLDSANPKPFIKCQAEGVKKDGKEQNRRYKSRTQLVPLLCKGPCQGLCVETGYSHGTQKKLVKRFHSADAAMKPLVEKANLFIYRTNIPKLKYMALWNGMDWLVCSSPS